MFPFLPWFSLLFLPQLFVNFFRQPFCLLVFCFLCDGFGHCLLYSVIKPLFIVLQSVCLSDLIPWNYTSPALYNHQGFDFGHIWMSQWFPLLFQFKSEFCNEELMIWVTVSSRSCFCSLDRTSPSLASKNVINLLSVLTIWQCLCVELSFVLVVNSVRCVLLTKLC